MWALWSDPAGKEDGVLGDGTPREQAGKKATPELL